MFEAFMVATRWPVIKPIVLNLSQKLSAFRQICLVVTDRTVWVCRDIYADVRSLSVCGSTRRRIRIIGSSHRRSSDDRLARAASIRGSHGARRVDRQRGRMV